ncbi:MAG: hypothetical protein K0B10_11755 [Vicingaceae bacterium]|nr:hypothetical protein [Vicingaceae bacterium]
MKNLTIILIILTFLSCKENNSQSFFSGELEKVNYWKNYLDTLESGSVVSFDYPSDNSVYRDGDDFYIENKFSSHDNTQKLGIFFSETKSNKIDSLIRYEKTKFDFEIEIIEDSVFVDNQNSLRVNFINNESKELIYRKVYLVKHDAVFEILDSNSDSEFYNKIISSIHIK